MFKKYYPPTFPVEAHHKFLVDNEERNLFLHIHVFCVAAVWKAIPTAVENRSLCKLSTWTFFAVHTVVVHLVQHRPFYISSNF